MIGSIDFYCSVLKKLILNHAINKKANIYFVPTGFLLMTEINETSFSL